jgi:hypothetical protein
MYGQRRKIELPARRRDSIANPDRTSGVKSFKERSGHALGSRMSSGTYGSHIIIVQHLSWTSLPRLLSTC